MNIENLREYCLSKPGATEGLPFGEDTLVFKVGDKIFLLTSLDKPISFNAKCDPDKVVEFREKFSEIVPGYHMNKKYWNTVYYNGSLPKKLLEEMVDHSYDLVFKSLPKILQNQINEI